MPYLAYFYGKCEIGACRNVFGACLKQPFILCVPPSHPHTHTLLLPKQTYMMYIVLKKRHGLNEMKQHLNITDTMTYCQIYL